MADQLCNFERLSLIDRQNTSQQINYAIDQKRDIYYPSPVTLEYRSSIASTVSSSSRYSATYTPPLSRASTLNRDEHNKTAPQILSPEPFELMDPNGCFVPCKQLPLAQQNETTRHHFVAPFFAMPGQRQADILNLFFNYIDERPFNIKQGHERSIPFNIDYNISLITLAQYTPSTLDLSESCLYGLGQRLGITSILIPLSIDSTDDTTFLDAIAHSIQATDFWERVILLIDQPHTNDIYLRRKLWLTHTMPALQKRFGLSQPVSVLFMSTDGFAHIKHTQRGIDYQHQCQRILWQMMHRHNLSGRWMTEHKESTQDHHPTINILTEADESSSSDDDDLIGPTIITYVDFKKVKTEKKTMLQRRKTRRMFQKLNSYE